MKINVFNNFLAMLCISLGERIFTADYGSFIPSSTPGVYMAEEDDEGGSTTGSEIIEKSLDIGDKSISGYPRTHLDIQVS